MCSHHSSQEKWDRGAWYFRGHLETFRELYKTREFRLVLCADVSDFMVKHALEILQRAAEMGKKMGGLCHRYEPLVFSEKRTLLTRFDDENPGCSRKWHVPASAL
jgi:hypothetical protein